MNVFKNYHVIHLCMKNNLKAFKCMQLCVHVKAKLVFHRFLQKHDWLQVGTQFCFFLESSKWALFTLDFLCRCFCSCRYATCTLIYKYKFLYLILLLNNITCTRISSFHCLFVFKTIIILILRIRIVLMFSKAVYRCKQILSSSRQ